MGGEENGFACLPCKAVQQLHDLHLTGKIEEGGGFVQEDYRSFLCQHFGNHHLLSFAVAQGMYHPVGKVLDLDQRDGFFHDLAVAAPQPAPEAGIGTTPHAHQLLNGHIAYIASVGQHHPYYSGQLLIGIQPYLLPHHPGLPIQLGLEGRKCTQQGGFTRPVGSQQAGKFASVDGRVYILCHNFGLLLSGIAYGKGTELDGM